MDRIPILRMGTYLLVTIQVDMHDQLAMTLQDVLLMVTKSATMGALEANAACMPNPPRWMATSTSSMAASRVAAGEPLG